MPSQSQSSPTDLVQARSVEFPASREVVLRGQIWGDGAQWAVLVHDEGRDLDAWKAVVGWLLGAGLCVIAFDLRGHGASDGEPDAASAPQDVLAALRFAESQGARWKALIGAGLGATAAMVAAGERDVAAIVALSPRARIDGIDDEAIRTSRAPKLFVAGSLDRTARAEAEDAHLRTIGWTVLATPPTAVQGSDLLTCDWAPTIVDNALAFLNDYR